MLLRHTPSLPLQPFVDCIWFSERGPLPHTRERSLPTGCADIVIPLLQDAVLRYDRLEEATARRLRGAVIQGPQDRFTLRGTEGPSRVVGVHFRPGGAAALLGPAVGELVNRTELLEDLWGAAARELRERLQACGSPAEALAIVEAQLLQRLRGARPLDAMVIFALRQFRRDPSACTVEPVQRASGCSPQQFIRRFHGEVGLTPKRYGRVLRFNAVIEGLAAGGERDWAQVALAGGFYDQAHLVHEFREMAGLTPGAYRPVSAQMPTHVAL
ncbi:MAG TPA: helix-turn-helix domain-containing protein [Albitalea sp.]|uniref:helix-turn-helix domain-containing protein n=1 Tax=Piscinibacter sp. TaxID=1903157 RepID=UPI002ED34405